MVSDERPEYLAYLLRMWRVDEDGGSHWRASLERPSNGERLIFTSLETLFEFLRHRAGGDREPRPPGDGGRGSGGESGGPPGAWTAAAMGGERR
jgi:hypothetical protein